MALNIDSEIRDVYGISDPEKMRIMDFLQGAVYCWCKNRKDEWFSIRDLMGGENFVWIGTPLQVLYLKHENQGKDYDEAVQDAGKDSGWILKRILQQDVRLFETKTEERIRKYRWIIKK